MDSEDGDECEDEENEEIGLTDDEGDMIEVDNNVQDSMSSQVQDYIFRGDELQDMSVYELNMFTRRS